MRAGTRTGKIRIWLVVSVLLLAGVGVAIYVKPRPENMGFIRANNPALYSQMLHAFTQAAIAIKSGSAKLSETADVDEAFIAKPTVLVPQEPAGWANLGLWYLVSPTGAAKAETALAKAHSLAPENGSIEAMLGLLATKQMNRDAALPHYRKAVEDDPGNVRLQFLLSEALRIAPGDNAAERLSHLSAILTHDPLNVKVLFEVAKAQAEGGQLADARTTLLQLTPVSGHWTSNIQQCRTVAQAALGGADREKAAAAVTSYRNVASDTVEFRASSRRIMPMNANYGVDPLERFLRLPNPSAVAAPPDPGLLLTAATVSGFSGRYSVVLPVCLEPELDPLNAAKHKLSPHLHDPDAIIAANGKTLAIQYAGKMQSLQFPGGPKQTPPLPNGVLALDWSYHYKMDLVLAGAGGVRLLIQQADSSFKDVTAGAHLPPEVVNASYTGAWTMDIDSDGALDIILGSLSGPPTILRNNGDATFTVEHPFDRVSGIMGCAIGDLDGDGAPDVAIIDGTGGMHLFHNAAGTFIEWLLPERITDALAIAIGDVNHTGYFQAVVARASGSMECYSYNPSVPLDWEYRTFASSVGAPQDGTARMWFEDMDNNGSQDIVATGSLGTIVLLSDSAGGFHKAAPLLELHNAVAAQADGPSATTQGRVDLVGTDPDGTPVRAANTGTLNYGWAVFRPIAVFHAPDSSKQEGDKRMDTYGLNSTFVVRADLLVTEAEVQGARVHVGLGSRPIADYVACLWPDGRMNAYFNAPANASLVTPQDPGGSCPWLFAWNGHSMEFVKDILWSSPLGLRINAQATAGIGRAREWVKVPGDALAPRDGYYDLRITAELWETHFFDMVKLMAVDHPAGTEVNVDERFAIPPPPLEILKTGQITPVSTATDEHGNDVTNMVNKLDGRYLDTFSLGAYQGIAQDHFVEVDLGPEAASPGPLWLICMGWVHPTDSGINVAISKGSHSPPTSLSLEVPDGSGGWKTARSGLGFPAGKNKTVPLNLSGLLPAQGPYKVRLRTNLEVYWDFIGYAHEQPTLGVQTHLIDPNYADLHYRGFSRTTPPQLSSPLIPDYNTLVSTGQKWRDLEGYYTRYGDVRELLAAPDDRYVIMNAGDEISLRFPALPDPPVGWVRDYVFVSDGWEKDGNFDTGFSHTVLPLPAHSDTAYNRPPTTLENDPVYQKHRADWLTYQTRYVFPWAVTHAYLPSAVEDRLPPQP